MKNNIDADVESDEELAKRVLSLNTRVFHYDGDDVKELCTRLLASISHNKAADEALRMVEDLLDAAFEYVNYEHDSDPETEDARSMGEMTLNDMRRDGRLEKCKQLVESWNAFKRSERG
jgi:hypothetical protein